MPLSLSTTTDSTTLVFTTCQKIKGVNGDFYLIRAFDFEQGNKLYLRIDQRFADLVEPELQALSLGTPTAFEVIPDPGRPSDLDHYRLNLDYYRQRKDQQLIEPDEMEEPAAAPEPEVEPVFGKTLTFKVPVSLWLRLRAKHAQSGNKKQKFCEFLSEEFVALYKS